MLETVENTDYQNCLASVLTIIAQKPELSMNYCDVFPRLQMSAVSSPLNCGEDALAERCDRTMSRIEEITQAGYEVNIIWECEFDAHKIIEKKPELLTLPNVRHSRLFTRDALHGGRTEAMVHYMIEENESIEYCDVMSQYPYICKYYKFLIGHPITHLGDTCKNIEACLQMESLIKCTVVPPRDLYHPVLPFRCNKKFYSVCRTCVLEQNMCADCQHFSDAYRAISGTWVTDETRMAVKKRYKILEIYEVYEYKVIQYNRDTGEGGPFVEYINTFPKLKEGTSGYPGWVRTPPDDDQYIEEFQ